MIKFSLKGMFKQVRSGTLYCHRFVRQFCCCFKILDAARREEIRQSEAAALIKEEGLEGKACQMKVESINQISGDSTRKISAVATLKLLK